MNRPDHSTFREWLNLDADGMLGREERARLEEHLAGCEECRREREELLAFEKLLERSALPLRSGFADSVMAALPAAGWEARAPRAWRFPLAVAAMLMLVAGLMVAGSTSSAASASSAPAGLAVLDAVGSMLRAATLAGAGLLGASWKGIGLIVEDVISSPVSLGAFGFLVLCLNLLLVSLLRRRRPSVAPAASQASARRRETNGGR